jgi:hypothetical protein
MCRLVLQGNVLRYYDEEKYFTEGKEPIGTLPCKELAKAHYYGSEKDEGKRFDVWIHSGRDFHFRAPDVEQAQAWYKLIEERLNKSG